MTDKEWFMAGFKSAAKRCEYLNNCHRHQSVESYSLETAHRGEEAYEDYKQKERDDLRRARIAIAWKKMDTKYSDVVNQLDIMGWVETNYEGINLKVTCCEAKK